MIAYKNWEIINLGPRDKVVGEVCDTINIFNLKTFDILLILMASKVSFAPFFLQTQLSQKTQKEIKFNGQLNIPRTNNKTLMLMNIKIQF